MVGIEGEDVNISCNSTGIPIPTITWTVDNQAVTYSQTDITYDYSAGSFEEGSFEVNPGVIISSLLITNLQYSAHHDVVYVCTGQNIYGEDTSNSYASTRLQVLGTTCLHTIMYRVYHKSNHRVISLHDPVDINLIWTL